MDMQQAIRAVTERQDLSDDDMRTVMRLIMTGEATAAQIGGFLVGLRMKGETIDEIAAAATVMRELATHVGVSGPHLVDTCGTGGDGASTFNISTASAFVGPLPRPLLEYSNKTSTPYCTSKSAISASESSTKFSQNCGTTTTKMGCSCACAEIAPSRASITAKTIKNVRLRIKNTPFSSHNSPIIKQEYWNLMYVIL